MHDFKFVSVERMCEYLWDMFVTTGRTLHFYFDIRVNISVTERYQSPEYLMTIAPCGELYVVIITRSNGEEMEAKAIHRQVDFVKYAEEYCNKHNPGKWKDTVCIDFSDWKYWGYDYE